MVGRLHKGSLIIGRKNAELGKAYKAIMKKYGNVEKEADYYHRGNGEWTKYSPSRDAKFKSKMSKDFKLSKANMGDSRYDRKRRGYV